MIQYKKAQKILSKSKIKINNEIILTKNSISRISANDVFSPYNYPSGNNTAFDGYAVSSKETIGLSKKKRKNLKFYEL